MKKNNVFTIVNSLPLKQIQSNHKERPHAIVQTKKHSEGSLHPKYPSKGKWQESTPLKAT